MSEWLWHSGLKYVDVKFSTFDINDGEKWTHITKKWDTKHHSIKWLSLRRYQEWVLWQQ